MSGLFRRKKKQPTESAITLSLVELCAEGFCAVVGESHYQETLRATRSGCAVGPEGRPAFTAALLPEPDNPHDSNAIAIYSPEGKIGYLARDDALAYEELFAEIRLRGYQGGACEAYLTGGEPNKPSFGVVLCLADPEDCLAELGVSGNVDSPTGDGNEGRGLSSGTSETRTDLFSGLEDRDLSEELSDERRFSRRPPEYERLITQGQEILAAEQPDLEAAAACFREAAGKVEPGFDRAYVLGQLASIYLRLERPASAVQTLLSEPDWPHHVPAAFETLVRAAVDAEQLEPFRWLATRSAEYHEPSVATLDRGLQLALYRKHYEFAEQLLGLVAELTADEDPLPPLLCGLLREKQELRGEAINAYLEAASLGSNDPRCFRRLTLLLDKEKRREEAAEWCRRALAFDLEASARQEIEKRLARLEAAPGKKRSASAKVIPLYPRRGEARIDRLASFPVIATDAVQGVDRVWAYGRRSGSPYLWMRHPHEEGLDVELDFEPRSIHCRGSRDVCLVIGLRDGQAVGRAIRANGTGSPLKFDSEPGTVICLEQGFVLSLQGGSIESHAWTGEQLWKTRLGQGVVAYWLAADADRVLASHLNRIYELDLETGQVRGRAEFKEEPQEFPGELVTITLSMGDPWVRGLGFAYGHALATDGTRVYEIDPGPRLKLVEPGDRDDHLQLALTDEDGQLLGFQGGEFIRAVRPDGHLGPKVPVPWARHELARLPDGRLASFGNRDLAVLQPTGAETHFFEAANNIRSLCASQEGIRVVVGRDLLRVTLS